MTEQTRTYRAFLWLGRKIEASIAYIFNVTVPLACSYVVLVFSVEALSPDIETWAQSDFNLFFLVAIFCHLIEGKS